MLLFLFSQYTCIIIQGGWTLIRIASKSRGHFSSSGEKVSTGVRRGPAEKAETEETRVPQERLVAYGRASKRPTPNGDAKQV